ncbi:MAG: hypothetical protein JNL90_16170 [Planctomycetes bacterium]|nr:hypothetical protein [Planctomycetota bacterium]
MGWWTAGSAILCGALLGAASLAGESQRAAPMDASVERWNGATLRLFAATCSDRGAGNVGLFAPALVPALDLLAAGAAGTTREQLVAALGAPDHGGTVGRERALRRLLGDRFDVALRAWVEESLALREPWQQLLTARDRYHGRVDRFALPSLDRAALAAEFNDWASEVVAEKVTVVQASDLAGPLRLVLGCASRVEWKWVTPFDPEATAPRPFTPAASAAPPAAPIELPTMHLRHPFARFEVAGLPAVRLPCEGELALDLIRVGADVAVRDALLARPGWLAELDAARLQAKERSLLVALPKLDSFTLHELVEPLRALGVTAAFDPGQADFSALAGDAGQLFVDLVRHACGVRWDEEGGKALGVTVVTLKRAAPRDEELRFDAPFLALLRGSDGAVLLAQWIADPRGAATAR